MERHPLHSATPHRLRGRWQPPLYFPLGHFALQTDSTSEGQDRVKGGQTPGFSAQLLNTCKDSWELAGLQASSLPGTLEPLDFLLLLLFSLSMLVCSMYLTVSQCIAVTKVEVGNSEIIIIVVVIIIIIIYNKIIKIIMK